MSKYVRLADGIVVEIIPNEATPVAYWYGEAFASHCVEAPDEVTEGMAYDVTSGTFGKPVPTIQQQIEALKVQLSSSDYKVIKCAECSLAGLPAPYDIVALNTERQEIRDQINTLEASET